MLIEIHMLQNHAPSNLNRDDTGSPKDCVFGGVRRCRISSQCLKRSARRSTLFTAAFKDGALAVRTRRLPEKIREILISHGISEKLADIAAVKASGFGTKDGKERPKDLNTAQTMFLSDNDIQTMADALMEAISECKSPAAFEKVSAKDLQAKQSLKKWRPITPDIALFGRMITSAAFQDVEASMQVAHAFSTNKMDHEFDYFTAVDDLQKSEHDDDSLGADMIGDVEFNSACYYKYFSLDLDALVANLAGPKPSGETIQDARQIAEETLKSFLEAIIFTTPSGKQNSFAAHQLPDAVLIEIRPKQTPVSYANAFIKPARPSGEKDLMDDSLEKFIAHVNKITKKFSLESKERLWFTTREYEVAGTKECMDIKDLLTKLQQSIQQGA